MASTTAVRIVWEFQVKLELVDEFEQRYGPEGDWVRLFREGHGFRQTILSVDKEGPGHYLLSDIWDDQSSYHDFKRRFREKYDALDHACESLTLSERRIGIFEYQ